MENLNQEQYQEILDKMQVITEYLVMQIPEIEKNPNYQTAFDNSSTDKENKKFRNIENEKDKTKKQGVFTINIDGEKSNSDIYNDLSKGVTIEMQVNYEDILNVNYNGEKIPFIIQEKIFEKYTDEALEISSKIYQGKVYLENNKCIFDYEHYYATEKYGIYTTGEYFDCSRKEKCRIEKELESEIDNLYEIALQSQTKKRIR